ncbi:formate dehydrogenase accessory sulfurtransferase FdhD [Emcibacter sp. SYSU 3D8]|uniref:formate dehydrogenase accessory sulfurtransferase FdhD n=1 Tax=Emcibacter sp. SYSU 3D8 TaxID=3133969 RepID=UPI0031FE65B5
MSTPVRRAPRFRGGDAMVSGRLESTGDVRWHLAEEVPAALAFNNGVSVVMMVTPADLEDFAVGFAISEGMVPTAADITKIDVLASANGYVIDIRASRLTERAGRERAIAGRTGCGLCGVDSLEDAVRPPRAVTRRFPVGADAAARALAALPEHQPLNRLNHSVHAAAWCGPSGDIRCVREDVGRHNALDKLLGALLRGGLDPADGFVALSSRCSFELVQKAAALGVPYLASISAPTTLALSMAREAGMGLACLSPDGIVTFGAD